MRRKFDVSAYLSAQDARRPPSSTGGRISKTGLIALKKLCQQARENPIIAASMTKRELAEIEYTERLLGIVLSFVNTPFG